MCKETYVPPVVECIDLGNWIGANILVSQSTALDFSDWEEADTIEDWGGVDQY